MKHPFTATIVDKLRKHFGQDAEAIFNNSELIKYINQKTVSANKGSKARGSFGNLYAIYVLVEDYINKGFTIKGDYSKYEGARFSDLLKRQRELPFGTKLQNHALNQRMNQEFRKYFPTCSSIPILRVVETRRYWINSNLIIIDVNHKKVDLSSAIIDIIDSYVASKKSAFENFIEACKKLKGIENQNPEEIMSFILGLLAPNVDARIFEIVSYSILKVDYSDQIVYFGFNKDSIQTENLKLYKTGRTNANDGGIDFVMKPLGRFFQVTETTDVKKYFLDIDKLEKFPITFVIKSTDTVKELAQKIEEEAKQQYSVEAIVKQYVSCIEEIINIDKLKKSLQTIEKNGNISDVLSEIIKQSKVEFNYNKE